MASLSPTFRTRTLHLEAGKRGRKTLRTVGLTRSGISSRRKTNMALSHNCELFFDYISYIKNINKIVKTPTRELFVSRVLLDCD